MSSDNIVIMVLFGKEVHFGDAWKEGHTHLEEL